MLCVVPILVVILANPNIANAGVVVTPTIADVSSENPVGLDRGAGQIIKSEIL